MSRAENILRARVTMLMIYSGLNQTQLAECIECSDGLLSDFLRGSGGLSMERLDGLARAFNVPVADLFNIDASAEPARKTTESSQAIAPLDPALTPETAEELLFEFKRILSKVFRHIKRETALLTTGSAGKEEPREPEQ